MKSSKLPATIPTSYSYLQYLWGVLTALTALFPLINIFWRVVPVGVWWREPLKNGQALYHTEVGSFTYLPVALITLATLLIVVFMIFVSFSQHDLFKAQEVVAGLSAQAFMYFGLGTLALLAYLGLSYLIAGGLYWNAWGWTDKDFRMVPFDLVLLITYSGSFGSLSRAFALLAIKEHLEGTAPALE